MQLNKLEDFLSVPHFATLVAVRKVIDSCWFFAEYIVAAGREWTLRRTKRARNEDRKNIMIKPLELSTIWYSSIRSLWHL